MGKGVRSAFRGGLFYGDVACMYLKRNFRSLNAALMYLFYLSFSNGRRLMFQLACINVGVFYAISTLLNQMVLFYYPGEEERIGWMGLTIVISGMLGSVACGVLLDKTHRFKETCLGVYILSLCGMIAFTVVLRYGNMWSLFLMAGLLGFFMTGYLPLGFEFAAELTYPEAESISSGLLNASAQVFGIIFTAGAGEILEDIGDIACNSGLAISLVIGSIITGFIKSDLRRLKASQLEDESQVKINSC